MTFENKNQIAVFYYWGFLLFFLVRIFDGLTFSQIGDPFIYTPRLDPIIWIANWTGLGQVLIDKPFNWLLDASLICIPIIVLWRIYSDKTYKLFSAILAVLFFIYVVVLYTFPTLSVRKYLGLVLLGIAFVWEERRFWRYIEILRYFVIFFFVSAGLWKVFRGSVFQLDQMKNILLHQHADHYYYYSDSLLLSIPKFLIEMPMLGQFLFIAATLLQLTMAIGFFTRKYDKILLALMIVFIISDFALMWIGYWEFLIFAPLFLLPKKLPF